MAYNEFLAERIREFLKPYGNEILEKKMFGGISFLFKGKMSVGIVKDDLCIRYIESEHPDLMQEDHVRPMNFTGKVMKEMAFVSQEGYEHDEDLKKWIKMSIDHAISKSD